MKNFIDSSIWIKYVKGEALPADIISILEEGSLCTSALCIAEVAYFLLRYGKDPKSYVAFMMNRAAVIPVDDFLSLEAAKIKHAQRIRAPKFGLSDAVAYATAQSRGAMLITSDRDFDGLAEVTIV
ncbi:MAG: hypothetical protein A2675_02435 [Candidatus Yonathbacteria bacterium RIFCSPHIGHO2_01_FULL_51_10]|uniref:PIN domain-containing protein n=1 Tax=Candidatus Yonathbacteria bacterium RIFCSPHIGHO2_01_FULL_51_10 TaxID=1802723 RepID=A0A1G2S7D4_9BACT|nr:MAG: hypothetical protein A2675_02435 [Candidatus Yonathbacteria bacterium RIFCSPHIGHO2_01_FULL_51_10]